MHLVKTRIDFINKEINGPLQLPSCLPTTRTRNDTKSNRYSPNPTSIIYKLFYYLNKAITHMPTIPYLYKTTSPTTLSYYNQTKLLLHNRRYSHPSSVTPHDHLTQHSPSHPKPTQQTTKGLTNLSNTPYNRTPHIFT